MTLTPREYAIIMSANVERIYDDYERMAVNAMYNRKAQHEKKLRISDLYKRPDGEKENMTVDDVKERQRAILERVSKYEQFADKLAD